MTLTLTLTFWSTSCVKNCATWCFLITLANVDQFSKFFHQLIHKKILYVYTQRFPPHLHYVATLPCESRKSKNVRILLRISWWKNFENRSTFAKVNITHQVTYFLRHSIHIASPTTQATLNNYTKFEISTAHCCSVKGWHGTDRGIDVRQTDRETDGWDRVHCVMGTSVKGPRSKSTGKLREYIRYSAINELNTHCVAEYLIELRVYE